MTSKTTTAGKVAGALGLVLVLSSPFTYFITTGLGGLAAFKAILGLFLIGFYFATNYQNFGQLASGRGTFYITSSALTAAVALAGLGAVNYIAAKKNKTWDLTNKKIYTLAPQTSSTLRGLKEPVKAIGFVDPSHPYYDAIESLFQRYHREAPDKFDYVFKSPRKSPDLAAKYQLKEGQTTVVLTRGQGPRESHTTLNVVSEQELTNALIKLGAVGEQKVYFTVGHEEWPLQPPEGASQDENTSSLSELKKELSQEGYDAEALSLAGKTEVPKDAALVVVAGARHRFAEPEAQTLKKYLDEGGRVIVFVEAGVDAGLEKATEPYGVKVDPGIIADDKFAVSSPYLVLSLFYGNHEMVRMLRQMQMNTEFPTARGLTIVTDQTVSGLKAEPVVMTSPYAWEEQTPNDNPSPSPGERKGSIPLVVASTAPSSAPSKRYDEARLVVFGDSEILTDANWGHEANRNLVLNAIGWATNQVNKITIRPPDRDVSTLDIDRSMLAKIRFISTDLLPLSLLGVGLSIWLTRRNR